MVQDVEFMAKASLREKLETVIRDLPSTEVTLNEILESIGKDSLMFLTIFLSLVFLVPVSIPGVSTVFGSAILLIGISHLFNRSLRLPARLANRTIATDKLTVVLCRALVWFRRIEGFIRPNRFQLMAGEGKIGLFNRLSYILAAVLLMVPFGFIPFSNTLPAIALILLAMGTMHKDGGCLFAGHLTNLITIIYFVVLITGGGMTIYEALGNIS